MKIPKKQSDIKLKDFLTYQKFILELDDEQKNDELLLSTKMLNTFYGIDETEIPNMPYSITSDLIILINNIIQLNSDVVLTFNIDGVEYGIMPNFDDITLAELVDCNTPDVLQQICVLYRPITSKSGHKYKIKKYDADISNYELFKEKLTYDIYSGFISFFLRIQKDLTNYTLKFLMEQDITPEQRKVLEESGVGSDGFMNSVMEIY